MPDSFDARSTFPVDGQTLPLLPARRPEPMPGSTSRACRSRSRSCSRTCSRHEDGVTVTADDIKALASWDPKAEPRREIAFRPSRVLLQDFTGVPAIVDLAAMRDAMKRLGGDPKKINPLQPVELVIDHSVQVDEAGHRAGLRRQRRAGVRAQPRALRLPPLGPERLRQLPRRPARHRHRPPGQSRVPGPRGLRRRERRRARWPIPTRWSAPTRTRR